MIGLSDLVETVGTFKKIIENPISRGMLKYLLKYCYKDGGTRLDVAMQVLSGLKEMDETCFKCRLATHLVKKVIDIGAESFGASKSEVYSRLRDTYWRRALSNVIKGLLYFGVRKPFVPGAPFLVVWDITYACNLRCKHCYANAGKPLKDELTTEEAKHVIDLLVDAGVVAIAWSGGEPLVRPDIYELSSYASKRGIYVAMATNGTLINDETARKLRNAGVEFLQISLDGAKPETHDEFRGIPGAWERTVRGIRNAVKHGFFVNIATTATKYNWKEIPDIIDLADRLGADWFMMYNFIPTGRGTFIEKYDLNPEERETLLKFLWKQLNAGRKIKVLTTAPQFARVALEAQMNGGKLVMPTHFYNAELGGRLSSLADFIGGCGAGRFYFGLSPNGDIRPCVFFPMIIGNILEIDDFGDWWRTNDVLNKLRNKDIIEEPCGSCRYRYVCGGCRARAYGYLGDYLAPDPGCKLVSHRITVT